MSVIRPIAANSSRVPDIQFEAIRKNRTKIYQAVAEQIQRRIIEELEPGDALPSERELVRMFGVSRSSVRDAIRELELMGWVEPRQGAGTVVREPSTEVLSRFVTSVLLQKRKALGDLLDFRRMVEPPLARCAALHASPEQIAEMEEILGRQESKLQVGEIAIEEDSKFHYCVALATKNSVAVKVVDVLMDLLRKTREHSLQSEGRQQKSLAGHRRILAALKRGDASAAEEAMRRHLWEIEKIVLQES